jgi:hypothetical protein
MRSIVRGLGWLLAAAPLGAAAAFAALAPAFPEAWQRRAAAGETTMSFGGVSLETAPGEAMHQLGRALHGLVLCVPGMTVRASAIANVVLAAIAAMLLAGFVRRRLPALAARPRTVLFAVGVLVAAPSAGVHWLHGERIAAFVPPIVAVLALRWLACERRPRLAFVGVLLLAAAAPAVHAHGALVFVALAPAAWLMARARASTRPFAGAIALLVVGNVTALVVFRSVVAGGLDWPARALSSPLTSLLDVLEATGRCWGDPLTGTGHDERLLGAASWLLLLAFVRSAPAAASRGLLLFGLGVVAWQSLRHGLDAPAESVREAALGGYCVPIGAALVLGTRFGMSAIAATAGMLAVLAVQDWQLGLEVLRKARSEAEASAAVVQLAATPGIEHVAAAAAFAPTRSAEELAALQARGLVPTPPDLTVPLAGAFAAPAAAIGHAAPAGPRAIEGHVIGSLRHGHVVWLSAQVLIDDAPPRVLVQQFVDHRPVGRNAGWRLTWDEALPEGARVRVLGLVPACSRLVALGPTFVVRGESLVVEGAQ